MRSKVPVPLSSAAQIICLKRLTQRRLRPADVSSVRLVLAEALRGRPIDMGGSRAEIIDKRRSVPGLSDINASMRTRRQPNSRCLRSAHRHPWPRLNVEDDDVDAVVALHLLEHERDADRIQIEVSRALKDDIGRNEVVLLVHGNAVTGVIDHR